MTPQEISDHKLSWLPGHSVIVHPDVRRDAVSWCNSNIPKKSWKLVEYTSVYEDTFRFETIEFASKFMEEFKRA